MNPISFHSFVTPFVQPDLSGGADLRSAMDNLAAKKRQEAAIAEQGREADQTLANRQNEFSQTQGLAQKQFEEGVRQDQRNFDEGIKQKKAQAIEGLIGKVQADPINGMQYAPALKARGIDLIPKDDGSYEFRDTEGNPVQVPPPAAAQPPAQPAQQAPQAPPAFAQQPMPGQIGQLPQQPPAQAAPSPQQGVTPPMPGESPLAYMDRVQRAMAGMSEDEKLAELGKAQEARDAMPEEPPPDVHAPVSRAELQKPVTETYENAPPPEGVQRPQQAAPDINMQTYAGSDQEEALSDARINDALKQAEAAPPPPQAQAAQAAQLGLKGPGGVSYGTINPEAIRAAHQEEADHLLMGFAKNLYPNADQKFLQGIVEEGRKGGIVDRATALDALKIATQVLAGKSHERAAALGAAAKASGQGPTLGATHDDLETLISHYEGKFNVGDMHKRQDAAAKVQNLITSPNPLAQREALTAELKNMFSSVTSDRELGFLQSAGGKLSQIESKFNEFFSGGELPANYRGLLAQASQIVDQGTAEALKRAAENAGAFIQKDPTLTMSGAARRQAAAIVMGRFTGNFGNAPNLEGPMAPAGATPAPQRKPAMSNEDLQRKLQEIQ